MSILDIKFSKFDNTPWGFRLAGGSDFPQPLTVIKVVEGSLAECMGLKLGDVVVRINDRPVASLTHGQAHEALMLAGNNFTLGVSRKQEATEAVEALQSDTIVPYRIPLEDLKPLEVIPLEDPWEKINKKIGQEEIEEKGDQVTDEDEANKEFEELEQTIAKPVDANSEVVPNKNLTDEEIATLILEEEELLDAGDQGVLGVNFKKLRPRAPLLKESKVLEELQTIALEEPPRVKELKHKSTFLQKPERPIPTKKNQIEEVVVDQSECYRVVIKKQPKKSVTERLVEKGLLDKASAEALTSAPSKSPTLDPSSIQKTISHEQEQTSHNESKGADESNAEDGNRRDECQESKSCENLEEECRAETVNEKVESIDNAEDHTERLSPAQSETPDIKVQPTEPIVEPVIVFDREKVKELVSTEISLEKQLENVQNQLLALKQLPAEIENHLKVVSEQLYKIMELSGVKNGSQTGSRRSSSDQECKAQVENREEERAETPESTHEEESTHSEADKNDTSIDETVSTMSNKAPSISIEEEIEPPETKELEVTLKSEDARVKKCIASYETRVFRSTPSPAPSYGSYEADPNLSPRDQVIQELKHRGGKKRSGDLWPQAKQLELTYGRRWRCPNDFFNDEMIAEVLSGQAEVIRGRAMGVNFKKYEKAWLPNYDHLMNSSVYRMLHKMEREPKTGIPARPPKVVAAEDIIERVNTPA
ncbi:uncharacterized protein LOC103578948 [Microplitis demolitor]|uniref:uncharacterized protein LOC103578948 n=1 Tax=Microplitis demolitor TaxID=69319 RepID=UPI0004CDB550|nr:uncharacterized protein LOC103578948 [Microplitis demolitor]